MNFPIIGQGGSWVAPVANPSAKPTGSPPQSEAPASGDFFALGTLPSSFPPITSFVGESQAPPPAPDAQFQQTVTAPTLDITTANTNTVTYRFEGGVLGAEAFELAQGGMLPNMSPSAHQAAAKRAQISYLGRLDTVEERYPGVVATLQRAEVGALETGYSPDRALEILDKIRNNPPWPVGSFPDNRARIAQKASQMAVSVPGLASKDATHYDLEAAQVCTENLLEQLSEAFPRDKFGDVHLSARAKAPGSLARKMAKHRERDPDYNLAMVTDTVGARLDCPGLLSLGKVAKKIEEMYGDRLVAKKDNLNEPGPNGYRALHYTVDLGDRMAEIQISTHLLRATDLATHDTLYKPEIALSSEDAHMLSTAADRAMYFECARMLGQMMLESFPGTATVLPLFTNIAEQAGNDSTPWNVAWKPGPVG